MSKIRKLAVVALLISGSVLLINGLTHALGIEAGSLGYWMFQGAAFGAVVGLLITEKIKIC